MDNEHDDTVNKNPETPLREPGDPILGVIISGRETVLDVALFIRGEWHTATIHIPTDASLSHVTTAFDHFCGQLHLIRQEEIAAERVEL